MNFCNHWEKMLHRLLSVVQRVVIKWHLSETLYDCNFDNIADWILVIMV